MRAIGIGAGGHSKMLLESLRGRQDAEQDVEVVGLVDADPAMKGKSVLGVPVLGGDEMLAELARSGIRHAFLGVGAVGDNSHRRQVFEMARSLGFELLAIVHPSAIVSPSAEVGEGTCIFPGAIVGAGARLGRNVIVNTGAIVEHDCNLGDHVHVACGAVLAGGVTVDEGAHVGAGAAVKQGVRVGRDAVVGLGAAVIDDVPAGATVAGVPAKTIAARLKA